MSGRLRSAQTIVTAVSAGQQRALLMRAQRVCYAAQLASTLVPGRALSERVGASDSREALSPQFVSFLSRKLESAGVRVAFVPETLYHANSQEHMVVGAGKYSPGQHDTYVQAEHLQQPLCGRSRPHFFRGVATIVAKLFNIVEPDVAVFGKKDYQQLCIIKAMVRDLNFAIEIVGGEILREADGLASSSRNKRLTDQARSKATCIHEGLHTALKAWKAGERNAGVLKRSVTDHVAESAESIDYVEVVHAETLASVASVEGIKAVIAVAALFPARDQGTVRLIDNIELE
jgi:pantoate--beta-alanine ligase